MGIAHICLECGQGLARVRVQLDPHYGLPLVSCPRCHAVAVRRPSPAMKQWQAIKRSGLSFGALGLQAVVALALITLTILAIISLERGEFRLGRAFPSREYYFGLAMLLGVLPLFTGAWLTFAFRHVKLRFALFGWASVIVTGLLVIGLGVGMFDDVTGQQYEQIGFGAFGAGAWLGLTQYVLPWSGIFALLLMFTFAGIPPGRLGVKLFAFARCRQRRWMLKRRRLRRSA